MRKFSNLGITYCDSCNLFTNCDIIFKLVLSYRAGSKLDGNLKMREGNTAIMW